MKVFDEINPLALESREFQLGILGISTIAVLSVALAIFMFMTVFSVPVPVGNPLTRKAFFAYCAMTILMIVYLLNRQLVIYRLKRKLLDDKARLTQIRKQANTDLLKTLPGMPNFQDRLTMEFRRCAKLSEPLSVLLFTLNPNSDLADDSQFTDVFGDAARALLLKMRRDDSLYLFESGVFAMVVAGCSSATVSRMTERFSDSLNAASYSGHRFSFTTRVINYPEEFETAREIEQAVRSTETASQISINQWKETREMTAEEALSA